MSDEMKGQVAGTAGLKPDVLFTNTRQAMSGLSAPPRRDVNTGVACPRCEDAGNSQQPVFANNSEISCRNGHKYVDNEELMSMRRNTVPVVMPIAQQEGYVPVAFKIPGSLQNAMKQKYADNPEKMNATFAALCEHIMDPNMLLIGETDKRRLSDELGIPIRTSAELFGKITDLKRQITVLQDQLNGPGGVLQPAANTAILRRGEMILWFDPPTTASLNEKAKNAGTRTEEFIEAFINKADKDEWL